MSTDQPVYGVQRLDLKSVEVSPGWSSSMQLRKRHILYIEDHEDTRELVTLVLEERNYQVTSDQTIAGGLTSARSQDFDLYLLDSWLPDGSGVELCQRIREFDLHTPILFYSAAAFEVDRETAINSGAQGYLIKPSHFSELSELITKLIDESQIAKLTANSAG